MISFGGHILQELHSCTVCQLYSCNWDRVLILSVRGLDIGAVQIDFVSLNASWVRAKCMMQKSTVKFQLRCVSETTKWLKALKTKFHYKYITLCLKVQVKKKKVLIFICNFLLMNLCRNGNNLHRMKKQLESSPKVMILN